MAIYQWNNVGVGSGWRYRVRIAAAGSTALDWSTPSTDTMIPFSALEWGKFSRGWDGLPLGRQRSPQLQLTWHLSLLPDDVIYNPLFTAILNPREELNITLPSSSPFYGIVDHPVVAGLIYIIDIEFTGLSTGYDYRLFTGIQSVAPSDELSADTMPIDITLDSISRVALSQTPIYSGLIDHSTAEYTHGYWELLHDLPDTSSWNYGINNSPRIGHGDNNWLRLVSVEDWDSWHHGAYTAITRALLRDSSITPTLEMPSTTYYRQLYDGTGVVGDALSDSELRFVYDHVYGPESATPYTQIDVHPMTIKYSSLWDYISDISESEIDRMLIDPSNPGVWTLPMYGYDGTQALDRNRLNNLTMRPNAQALYQVGVSMPEAVGSAPNERRFGSATADNDERLQIQQLFMTTPACPGELRRIEVTSDIDDVWAAQLNMNLNAAFHQNEYAAGGRRFGGHWYTLVYADNPSILGGNTEYVRVHEFCRTLIDNSNYNDDLTGCAISPIVHSDYGDDDPSGLLSALSASSGKHNSYGVAIESLHVRRDIRSIKFEIPIYTYAADTGLYGIYSPWLSAWGGLRFTMSLSDIDPRLTYNPSGWFPLDIEIDMATEIATVTLIARDSNAV